MIEFSCRSCGAVYKVSDDKAGKRGKCAKCGEMLQIPSLPQPVQQKAPAPAPQPVAAPAPQPVEPPAPPADPMDALAAALSGSKTKPASAPQPAAQAQQSSQAVAPAPAAINNIPVARPAGGNKKLWLAIAAGAVVLLAGAGIGAYFFLFNNSGKGEKELAELKALLAEANKLNDNAYDRSKDIDELKPADLTKAEDELKKAIAKYDEFFAAAKNISDPEAGKIAEGARYKYQSAKSQLDALDASIWPGPGDYRDMYLRVGPSVPLIALDGSSGSGFLIKHIDKYYIVTNRHVVENSEDKLKLEFYLSEDTSKEPFVIEAHLADIVFIHRSADLALIDVTAHKDELEANGIRPLILASRNNPPGVGESLWIVGHPGSSLGILKRNFSKGSVASVIENYLGENSCLIGIDATVNPGNSGGPILNDRGRVIGVVSFKLVSMNGVTENQNFGVHVAWLHHMFEDEKYNLSREEIERIAAPKKTLPEELKKVTEQLAAKGYKPVNFEGGQASHFAVLQQGPMPALAFFGATSGKEYIAVAIGAETNDGQLQVGMQGNDPNSIKFFAGAKKSSAVSVEVEFKPQTTARYCLTYVNMSRHVQPVILAVFEK